jgi:hypothetical protein
MELERFSPYPQEPATCPYPEPTPSSPHERIEESNTGIGKTSEVTLRLVEYYKAKKWIVSTGWNHKTDRQCTYSVTLRRVRATIVAVEKQRVLHNLCIYL